MCVVLCLMHLGGRRSVIYVCPQMKKYIYI